MVKTVIMREVEEGEPALNKKPEEQTEANDNPFNAQKAVEALGSRVDEIEKSVKEGFDGITKKLDSMTKEAMPQEPEQKPIPTMEKLSNRSIKGNLNHASVETVDLKKAFLEAYGK